MQSLAKKRKRTWLPQGSFVHLRIIKNEKNMEDLVKLSMVIKSHLTDADYEIEIFPLLAAKRINFVKMLVHKYPDTNVRVSEDELNELWKTFGKA